MAEVPTPSPDELFGAKLEPKEPSEANEANQNQPEATNVKPPNITPEEIEERQNADEAIINELRAQLGVGGGTAETVLPEQVDPEQETRIHLPEGERAEILRIENALKTEFRSETGADLENYLSGDIGQRIKANRYLFGKTAAETNPTQRRFGVLAHLDLYLKYDQAREFDTYEGKHPVYFRYEGMFANGMEIAKSTQEKKLKVDTEQFSEAFISFTERYIQNMEKLRDIPEGENLSKSEWAKIVATWLTTREYLGVVTTNSPGRNAEVYKSSNSVPLSEFKGARSAVCTEHTALSQQFLAFSGLHTTFISGGSLLKVDSEGEIEQAGFEGHDFNIIFANQRDGNTRVFIYDAANSPASPYLAPIADEQFRSLGKGAWVTHQGITRIYSIYD